MGTRNSDLFEKMKQKKMEKREYNSEKENLDKELSRLMAITLRLEDELNLMN